MGRLGTNPVATATPAAGPDHLAQTPAFTTSDQPENNTSDSITPVQVEPPLTEVSPRLTQDQPLPRDHQEDKDNRLEITEVVSFPPRPSVTADAQFLGPDQQLVVYVPSGSNTLPPSAGRPSNDQEPAVMFPPQKPANPVYGQPNDVASLNLSSVASAGNQQQQWQLQNQNGGTMPPVILVPFVGVPWHSGLFDCCQHPRNAIITALVPCVTFGQIAEILDNGSTSCLTGAFLYLFLFLVICHWNIGIRYRRRLRNAFQISETPLTDKMAHAMFPLCALCQEFRELEYRGLDPFKGYQGVIAGIVHGQNQSNIPPENQSMNRA